MENVGVTNISNNLDDSPLDGSGSRSFSKFMGGGGGVENVGFLVSQHWCYK